MISKTMLIHEVARYLEITATTVCKLIKTGSIDAIKSPSTPHGAGHWIFDRKGITDWKLLRALPVAESAMSIKCMCACPSCGYTSDLTQSKQLLDNNLMNSILGCQGYGKKLGSVDLSKSIPLPIRCKNCGKYYRLGKVKWMP